jgi:hypothetical protein
MCERTSHLSKQEIANHGNRKRTPIGSDLVIVKRKPRISCGGTWLTGKLNGHYFIALVFSEHAEQPDFEFGASRISKLWIKRMEDQKTMVSFDRGWDTRPKTKLASEIMDLLMANLADLVYKPQHK